MSIELVEQRLASYSPANPLEELRALKEIAQEIALAALNRAGFFKSACFHGGTCLRILHQLPRFSEDLDFTLQSPDPEFNWEPFFHYLEEEFAAFGLSLDTKDRSRVSQTVKKAFLKEDSFGQVLTLQHRRNASDKQKIIIKLEIDTNPPKGATCESAFLSYPYPFSVAVQDMGSLFAGKCHALLCRKFLKGRDWFDFLWYVDRKSPINFQYLSSALNQQGPWKNQEIEVDREWLVAKLDEKVANLDWKAATADVEPLVEVSVSRGLNNWDTAFFKSRVDQLKP